MFCSMCVWGVACFAAVLRPSVASAHGAAALRLSRGVGSVRALGRGSGLEPGTRLGEAQGGGDASLMGAAHMPSGGRAWDCGPGRRGGVAFTMRQVDILTWNHGQLTWVAVSSGFFAPCLKVRLMERLLFVLSSLTLGCSRQAMGSGTR